MQTGRPTMRSVLATLDPDLGGRASGNLEEIVALLRSRDHAIDNDAVRAMLDRLVAQHRVERVLTEDGSTTYTRPEVLLRITGVASAVSNPDRKTHGGR